MIKVRRLDDNHDWMFGFGLHNYAEQSEAISQCVKTRLWSFINDWFLDLDYGLPWLEKTGRNVNLDDWEVKIKRQVLETIGVVKILSYSSHFDPETRIFTVTIGYLDMYNKEHNISYSR